MPNIALYGLPGAGKSTFARLLTQQLGTSGVPCALVKIGAPLYELQALIYSVAGRPLLEPTAQDGLLLADLAGHLRRINPTSLTDLFAAKVAAAPSGSVLVCDDMRAPDVEAVTDLGFRLVEITAPEPLRCRRRQSRGDLSQGDEQHPSEAPVEAQPWLRVHNDGDLDRLWDEAGRVAAQVLR
ncbi:hypothetical protein [Nonomuraea aridisoli]|uniref:Uncharacterized protein n=1 Tax=Nonomuraea aridisoli TaxID=2070368 RepID=A0A2W2DAX3_9ACTN|nr:hypothetical protein [Nonomuraea aridisoli]PZG09156.1 hypothetical protein C1J01_38040 [Nonomuraea aridisoli]